MPSQATAYLLLGLQKLQLGSTAVVTAYLHWLDEESNLCRRSDLFRWLGKANKAHQAQAVRAKAVFEDALSKFDSECHDSSRCWYSCEDNITRMCAEGDFGMCLLPTWEAELYAQIRLHFEYGVTMLQTCMLSSG